ncbi:MAG: hypothetical protein ACK4NY_07795 [Spirosomataceae bacterium]
MKYLALIISVLVYLWLGYFVSREQIVVLFVGYGILFGCYLYFIKNPISTNFSILFRGILLFSLPALSDDFYRFVFDGRLLAAGINPYLILPSEFIQTADYQKIIGDLVIYQKLNSPNYYTVYPPLNQAIFGVSAWLSQGNLLANVILLRAFIFTAEIGNIWLISKLLRRFGLDSSNVNIYAFNPLVILELTGNLHFEAIMIFFMLLATVWITQQKYTMSAVSLALAISIKLLPMVFIPLIISYLKIKKGLIYSIVCGIAVLSTFSFFVDKLLISRIGSSIELYFQKFEFNASLYYLIREIGFWIVGYNIIGTAGKILAILTFSGIVFISFYRNTIPDRALSSFRDNSNKILLILTVYFLLATTVHPWYICTVLAASVFTSFRYPIVWTGLIFLTYFSYTTKPYQENLYLVGLEYIFTIGWLIYELKAKKIELKTL